MSFSKPSISPAELLRRIDNGEAPAILDVRSPAEFAHGHVPGAVNVPFNAIGSRMSEVPGGRSGELIVYCGHGPRAFVAAMMLRRLGRQVRYLRGHWAGWQRAGLRKE
jgi:rhodanese-related sulfurtransferase